MADTYWVAAAALLVAYSAVWMAVVLAYATGVWEVGEDDAHPAARPSSAGPEQPSSGPQLPTSDGP